MDSPSREEHDVPSHFPRIISEYANIRISGLRQRKRLQEKDNKRYGKPNAFGTISLFEYMAMSLTNSIIPKTVSFSDKLLHHEEKSKSSPENLTNFNNTLNSNIQAGNDNFTFKESTIQPVRLKFVEDMIKEIGTHEDYQHWDSVRRRELNWEKYHHVYMVLQ